MRLMCYLRVKQQYCILKREIHDLFVGSKTEMMFGFLADACQVRYATWQNFEIFAT